MVVAQQPWVGEDSRLPLPPDVIQITGQTRRSRSNRDFHHSLDGSSLGACGAESFCPGRLCRKCPVLLASLPWRVVVEDGHGLGSLLPPVQAARVLCPERCTFESSSADPFPLSSRPAGSPGREEACPCAISPLVPLEPLPLLSVEVADVGQHTHYLPSRREGGVRLGIGLTLGQGIDHLALQALQLFPNTYLWADAGPGRRGQQQPHGSVGPPRNDPFLGLPLHPAGIVRIALDALRIECV